MHVFLYEAVCGGGLGFDGPDPPSGSLLDEGLAMLRAAADDWAAVDGARLTLLRDSRLPEFDWAPTGCQVFEVASREEEASLFRRLARDADATLIVAPESNGVLETRVRWAEEVAARLHSPSSALTVLAADKHRAAEHLRAAGVAAPRGVVLGAGAAVASELSLPIIRKPNFGAGSQGIMLINDARAIAPAPFSARYETHHVGVACGVSWLSGAAGAFFLEPCRQQLGGANGFAYLGGETPLVEPLRSRALELARRAHEALPRHVGWAAADLVLGPAADGSDDVVIEINPRLTTSYVGLRRAYLDNLAEATLAVVGGETLALRLADARGWRWTAAGRVESTSAAPQGR